MYLKKEFEKYRKEDAVNQKSRPDSNARAEQSSSEPKRATPPPQPSAQEILAAKLKREEENRLLEEKNKALRAEKRAIWQKNMDELLTGNNLEKLVKEDLAITNLAITTKNPYPSGLSYYKPSEGDLCELIALTRELLSDPHFEAYYQGYGGRGQFETSLTPMCERDMRGVHIRHYLAFEKEDRDQDQYPRLSYQYNENTNTMAVAYSLQGSDHFGRDCELRMSLAMSRETGEKVLDAIRNKPLMVMGSLNRILLLTHQKVGIHQTAGLNYGKDRFFVPKWGESSELCKFIRT